MQGKVIGTVGLAALLASWSAIWVAPHLLPPQWVPRVWIVALLALPCAIVLGVVAGRVSSRWWYFVAGAGLLSAAVLLAGVCGLAVRLR